MAAGGWPSERSMLLALLYSVGAHGIMTLNDFKSIEGDKQMGIGSLPVQLGVDGAARAACFLMAGPQAVVVVMLLEWGAIGHALGVAGLLAVQLGLMWRFLAAPRERRLTYKEQQELAALPETIARLEWEAGQLAAAAEGDPERLAYAVFTSGTSGRAQAVGHAHRAIWARGMMHQGWEGLTRSDRLLHAGAMNWTFTLGTGLLGILLTLPTMQAPFTMALERLCLRPLKRLAFFLRHCMLMVVSATFYAYQGVLSRVV